MGDRKGFDERKRELERADGLRHLARHHRTASELRGLVRALSHKVDSLEVEIEAVLGCHGKKPIKVPKPKSNAKSPVMPWAMWSDQHLEERVEKTQTAGLNEHSLEISGERHERLVHNTARLMRERERIQSVATAGLWLGGDHITGHIHPDLVEVAECAPIRAAEIMHERLASGILYLLDELKIDKLYIPTNWGNHGRTEQGRPRIATMHDHNLEQMVFRSLARDFRDNDRVEIDCSDTAFKYVEVRCADSSFLIRTNHGDAFKYQGGLAGMTAPLSRFVSRMDQERVADLNLFGHWHTQQDLSSVRSLVNGSTIGHSEYSRRFGYEEPTQTFFWIDMERGQKAGVLPIWVT